MSDNASTAGAMALYTVRGEAGEPPSLESAAAQLGASPEDLDAAYGVVPIDPQEGLYAVQARTDRVSVESGGVRRYTGPYSSPTIVPLGSARKADEGD